MTFRDILAEVIDWLHQVKRVSYRALKRQFDLDDAYLDDLKFEIIRVQQLAVEEDSDILVWTGDLARPEAHVQPMIAPERRFHVLLLAVIGWLRSERRITYRALKEILGLDEALVGAIREELAFRQLAIDEDGKGLVWAGTESTVPAHGLIAAIDSRSDDPATTIEPIRIGSEAERRQLTVMFCDLADSTQLSQQLDAEDLREVVRAYQATAAEVIHQYAGHIAQYLGDGLLVYFGWPVAHEDDALRGVHVGLGLVEAITTTLNPRLEREKGTQLAVRIGLHTGPVVVGEMGGGGRHEHLATGDTVNIAARLEGLAQPNTVVLSSVTARLIEKVFALENLGPHELKGVAEAIHVFRVLGQQEDHEDETVVAGVPLSGGTRRRNGVAAAALGTE